MTVINSNSAALRAQNGTRTANMMLQSAMTRLSSGKRINSASDDAAGLAISNSMTSQITGMNQAIRNSNDGISLAQTADGAMDEVTNMLQRVRELAVQSASGTYSDSDRANMQTEVSQLSQQISSTLAGTKFNGVALFDTSDWSKTAAAGQPGGGTSTLIQIGSNSNQTVAINIGNLDTSALIGGTTSQLDSTAIGTAGAHVVTADDVNSNATYFKSFTADQVGSAVTLKAGDVYWDDTLATPAAHTVTAGEAGTNGLQHTVTAGDVAHSAAGQSASYTSGQIGTSLTLAATDKIADKTKAAASVTYTALSVGTVGNANSALSTIDGFLTKVSTVRATIGASESRLNSVVNSLTNNVTNLTDANSRIADADFSAETTNLAKAQILSQAATAMLAQANQSQQGVLKLLQ